jgi:hypothetical protein
MRLPVTFALGLFVVLSAFSRSNLEPVSLHAKAIIVEIRTGNWTNSSGPTILAAGRVAVRLRLLDPKNLNGTEQVLGITNDSQLLFAGGHRLAVGDVIEFDATEAVLTGDVLPAVFTNLKSPILAKQQHGNSVIPSAD